MESHGLEPLAVGMNEATRLVPLSRAKLYTLVMSNEIPSFKIGSRRLLSVAALREWVAQQSDGGAA